MEINHRFSIASYLGEKSEKTSLEGIHSTKFSQLIHKSQNSIQNRLDSPSLQEVFKNKSVSMLFLDKISNLIGKHHPNNLDAENFMGGPSFFPSLELIRHLSHLLKSELLSGNVAQKIKEWIASEQAYLPLSLIFDAWSAKSEELVFQTTTKGGGFRQPD